METEQALEPMLNGHSQQVLRERGEVGERERNNDYGGENSENPAKVGQEGDGERSK